MTSANWKMYCEWLGAESNIILSLDLGNAYHEINPYAEIICGLNAHGE
jgi:hypothetical protein